MKSWSHTATLYSTLHHSATLSYSQVIESWARVVCTVMVTHCNTMQHTATQCSTKQQTSRRDMGSLSSEMCITLSNTLQHTATHCNTLQHSATLCNTLQHSATLYICGHPNTPLPHAESHVTQCRCSVLQCVAVCCSVLQSVAECCNVLQCTAIKRLRTRSAAVRHWRTAADLVRRRFITCTKRRPK